MKRVGRPTIGTERLIDSVQFELHELVENVDSRRSPAQQKSQFAKVSCHCLASLSFRREFSAFSRAASCRVIETQGPLGNGHTYVSNV
jgi:hypothetical protein